jgi:hypothetical protein
MIVNNFNILSTFFDKLDNPEDFYFVQIIQRRKDGNEKREKLIKNMYIHNQKQFWDLKPEIIELCEMHNARAYFWINPRNSKQIALDCVKHFMDLIIQDGCNSGYKVWDKVCGQQSAVGYPVNWIIDIDTYDMDYVLQINKLIHQCRSVDGNPIKYIIPTKNGQHLITCKFDSHHFKQLCLISHIEPPTIHKDNPTLLYYAENERQDM